MLKCDNSLIAVSVACTFFLGSLAYTTEKVDDASAIRRRPLPFAGNGTCDVPVSSNGLTTVRCLGPEISMLPGQTIDAYIYLESPYPTDKNVTLLKQEAQMVAKTGQTSWRDVPLSELYFHHVVPNPRFLLGAGAEIRGSRLRQPPKHPYAFIVDGQSAAQSDSRLTNIQLVNIIGVPAKDVQQSIECWCGHDELGEVSNSGSLFCCKQRYTYSTAGPETYQLEYNVTYREVVEEDKRIDLLGFDATGGKLEYNIAVPQGPGTEHTVAIETIVDSKCPQQQPFTIVRCTAHQHIGSKCMHVYNVEADELICSSCAIYGNKTGIPGNELGYVVAIQDSDPEYEIKPGTRIRIESVYDGSQKRLVTSPLPMLHSMSIYPHCLPNLLYDFAGIMGLMGIWVSGLTETCGQYTSQDPMSLMAEVHTHNALKVS